MIYPNMNQQLPAIGALFTTLCQLYNREPMTIIYVSERAPAPCGPKKLDLRLCDTYLDERDSTIGITANDATKFTTNRGTTERTHTAQKSQHIQRSQTHMLIQNI
jgi:hypothetical protein